MTKTINRIGICSRKGGKILSCTKNNDNNYSKTIGKSGTLYCVKHHSFGDTWWEIDYGDEYIDKYIETDDEEVDHNNVEKVLKYADDWMSELIENIALKYGELNGDDLKTETGHKGGLNESN